MQLHTGFAQLCPAEAQVKILLNRAQAAKETTSCHVKLKLNHLSLQKNIPLEAPT